LGGEKALLDHGGFYLERSDILLLPGNRRKRFDDSFEFSTNLECANSKLEGIRWNY
jgi:hypothetical protein